MNPSQNPSAIRSKMEITETLLRLMGQIPYTEISVKHILLETPISRKTFYRNFSSKDDVLSSYIDTIMLQYMGVLENMGHYRMLLLFDVIFQFCELHRDFLKQLRDNHLLYMLLEKWNQLLPIMHEQIIKNKIEGEPIQDKLLTEYVIAFNVGAVWNMMVKWLEDDMQEPVENVKATMTDYLMHINELDLRRI